MLEYFLILNSKTISFIAEMEDTWSFIPSFILD